MTGGSAEAGAGVRVEGYVANDKRCTPECRLEWLRMHTKPEPAIASRPKAASQPIRTAAVAPAPSAPASSPPATAQSPAPPANRQSPPVSINADIFGADPLTGGATYTGRVELRADGLLLKADALTVEKGDPMPERMIRVNADHVERASDSSTLTYTGNVIALINGLILKTDRLTAEGAAGWLNNVSAPPRQPASYEEPQQTQRAAPRNDAGDKTGDELARRLGLLPGEKPGPAFASLFDADAPVYIRGIVTKVELGDPNSFIWIEGDKLYKVMVGRARLAPDFIKQASFVGTNVRVRGYQAKDKSCAPECLINGRDVTIELTPVPPPASPLPPT
jgi:lipopolysaccharide export system protein LptA